MTERLWQFKHELPSIIKSNDIYLAKRLGSDIYILHDGSKSQSLQNTFTDSEVKRMEMQHDLRQFKKILTNISPIEWKGD